MGMKKLIALVMALMLCLTAVSALAVSSESELRSKLEAGGTVTLTGDIALASGVTVPAGKTVTLDLNGKTISMTDSSGAACSMLTNKGTLVINDSVGGGKLSFCTTTPGGQSYVSNTISNHGTLTINKGTIENTTVGGVACYALDCFAGSTSTINGGKFTSVKTAVRIFSWGKLPADKITLNIAGGEIYSEAGYAVNLNMGNTPYVELNITKGSLTSDADEYDLAVYAWMDSGAASSAENVVIKVKDGELNGAFALNGKVSETMKQDNVAVTGGEIEYVECYSDPACKFVTGGIFEEDPSEYVAGNTATAKIENADALLRVFAIGASSIKTVIDEAVAEGATDLDIKVLSGDVQLTNVPAGTDITVAQGATAKVNGVVVTEEDTVIVPKMVDTNNKEYKNDLVYGGTGDVVLKSNDKFENFEYAKLYFNGKEIGTVTKENPENPVMKAESGSIKITVKSSVLHDLGYGTYKLKIKSAWGETEGSFAYTAPNVDLPQTGDNSSLMLWVSLLVMTMVGFVLVGKKTRLN